MFGRRKIPTFQEFWPKKALSVIYFEYFRYSSSEKKFTRTKVESDRLGRHKISYEKQVKEFSRGLSRGGAAV